MSMKNDIAYLGLNYRNEIIKLFLVNAISISLIASSIIFIKQIYLTIFLGLGTVMFNYLLLSSYSSKRHKLMEERKEEFIQLLTYFSIYISSGTNVYHAFECIIPYASEALGNDLKIFLENIDRDKSVTPYVDFAKTFNSSDIENVLNSIYQMVEDDNSNRLLRFESVFDELKRNQKKRYLDDKSKSLDLMNNFAIFGAGLVAIILTIGVVNVIGGMMNGL